MKIRETFAFYGPPPDDDGITWRVIIAVVLFLIAALIAVASAMTVLIKALISLFG